MNAIEALQAILHARDKGEDPSLILDENSPLVEAARAAIAAHHPSPSAAEQAGRWVPVKPTKAMHEAAVKTIVRCTGNDDWPPRVWRAMLAAAPSASPAEAPAAPWTPEAIAVLGAAQPVAPAGQAAAGVQGEAFVNPEDWLLTGEAATRIANFYRVTTGVVQAIAKAIHELRPAPAVERGVAEEQEPKYTVNGRAIVNRASGEEIPADEPAFILRARDVHAVYTLKAYAAQCGETAHALVVMDRVADFERFAAQHPERMKTPDTAIPAKSGRSPAPAVERGVAEERFEAWFDDPKSADNTRHYEIPASAHGEVKRLVRDIAQRAWIAALSTAGKEQA